MLSPKRAIFTPCASCQAHAARVHAPRLALHVGVLPVPDDHLALQPHAAADEPEFAVAVRRLVQVHEIHVDRRPTGCRDCTACADARTASASARSPAIHILAGENVCIHVISPSTSLGGIGLEHEPWISSGVVSTGLKTTRTGSDGALSRAHAISLRAQPRGRGFRGRTDAGCRDKPHFELLQIDHEGQPDIVGGK